MTLQVPLAQFTVGTTLERQPHKSLKLNIPPNFGDNPKKVTNQIIFTY